MELLSQNIDMSNDPETKGFDLSAGNTWIYPENYPVREYQHNIVKNALYNNSLICLPTGLGKTFIAAVVMYNFWRWYPFGKIVFLAPTKPLVAQQINACYEVMGIPDIDTIELTGAINKKNREIAWVKKRIIFATPQVFHNDLEKSIVPSHLIKCIVVDEAHKALGKHSYCECVRILSKQSQYFRILALSATPGNKIDNVHQVIKNLHISHLELRDENSIDIMPYVNKRKIDIILVPLSTELTAFKERYIVIMDRHVRLLMQYNVLQTHTANISKGRVFHLLREFKMKTNKSGNYNQIMKILNILLTMYHAYELMIRHGLRAFYKFYQNHSDKFWMHNEKQLQELLHDIEMYLGPFPDIQMYLSNEDVPEVPKGLVFGHNKFHKLKELLEHHFRSNNSDQKDTRAIVFVEYRDIVNEVYILLLQSKPVIRPQIFVGQASQKQKQQIRALEDFKSNRVNVLISTSIGEEGLDVGEVDLIICFDVSQHSPIRLVQRMGRTGRKRNGHIIVLVTDGKEHENLKSTLSKKDSLNNKILNTSNIFSSLYENNSRMIPNQFTPECHKIHIIALPNVPKIKNKEKKKDINKKHEMSNTKQKKNPSITTQKITSQSRMMTFFTKSKCNEHKSNSTCNILSAFTQKSNVQNTINPNKVKLLSDDNMGIDFLTLCAVKRSEEDISPKSVHKMDTTYIPKSKPITNLFNFVIPDMKVLDCLSFLNTDLDKNLSTSPKACEERNVNNDNIDIDDDNFWYTTPNGRNTDNDKIRFEDILDESSDSDKTIASCSDREVIDIKMDSIDTINNPPVFNTKCDEIISTRKELPTKILEDIEPSLFESILNDSSSSNEDDLEYKTTVQQNMSSNSPSILKRNIPKINTAHKSTFNNYYDNDNNDKFNHNISACTEVTKIQTNKAAVSFIDDMQDIDFTSADSISDFIHESNQNKSIHNTKAENNLLSVTQAISEIAKMKTNLENVLGSSVSKEERINKNTCDWNSVNTKCATKIEEKDTVLGTENRLSNINQNSIAKPCIAKEDFDFPDDSDEDFMITKINTGKFNELESSYFCNTWKYVKPCSTSTSINKKYMGLSLKRNNDSGVINSNIVQTSTKQVYDVQNKSISESTGIDTPKATSSMHRKIAQKNKHKCKYRNRNEFIDDEAEVFSDISSDESTGTDEEIADFVSHTQDISEQIDIHAHYLQTVKSPIKRFGVFHFKRPRSSVSNIEIYSQPLSQVHDSYLYDSFCVNEDAEPDTLARNDSLLEKAERKLRRNKRKRLHLNKNNMVKAKRIKKINVLNSSVSSEDEIEKLRIQLQED